MPDRLLKNKTALITGGGKGIGLGISQAFLDAGASLAIVQRSPLPEVLDKRGDVHWIEADLGDIDSYAKIADKLNNIAISVDILVNNAGIMFEKTLDDMSLEDWQKMLTVNLTAPVFLCKVLLPQLRTNLGSIINIGSIEGIAANPEHLAYCATKGGIHAMTKAMAVDFGKDNVNVNAIAPGWIKSDLSDAYINAQQDPEAAWQGLDAMHPLGRIGAPMDVGQLAVFLASDNASFMTGQVIVLDGGRTSKLPLPF